MFYEFVKSPNFWKGRRGYKPEAIVIHITEGSTSSVIDWFTRPESEVSSHYLVTRKGQIIQFVKEEDAAWHAGVVIRPTWKLLKQGVNPNLYTIGIENEGYDNQRPTLVQAIVCSLLIGIVSRRWGIPIDQQHIIPHRWIDGNKICPGAGFNVGALAWLAKVIYD